MTGCPAVTGIADALDFAESARQPAVQALVEVLVADGPAAPARPRLEAALVAARRAGAAGVAAALAPPRPHLAGLTCLDLGQILVTEAMLANLAGLPALRDLTLATLADAGAPAPRPLDALLATLPALRTVRLVVPCGPPLASPPPAYAAGSPRVLAAAVRARPTLVALLADDVWDDDGPWPPPWCAADGAAPPAVHALCATLAADPAPGVAITLRLRHVTGDRPPAPWQAAADDRSRWLLAPRPRARGGSGGAGGALEDLGQLAA